MKLRTERARFLWRWLDLPAATQVDDAVWERFQIDHLNDDSTFRCETKTRQCGWSFTVAMEADAFAVLDAVSTVFVSINLEEAKEKVRYARQVHENLQNKALPRIVRDNILGLEFDNGARIISFPSKPPRGPTRMNVVLDEFAHVQHDKLIYTAALPILSKSGILRVGSSPMGAVGTFWEIAQQEQGNYSRFNRVITPWWKVAAFCTGPAGPAGGMATADRVERYGNERIQAIFDSLLLEDFQQEFECNHVDESISFFSRELIQKNQDADLVYHKTTRPENVASAVRRLKADQATGRMEPTFAGGVDVGRKHNLTEIVLVGCSGLARVGAKAPVRLMVSLDRVEFDTQEAVIREILGVLPVTSMLIDQNGLGMHLAENLARDTVCQGVDFTNASKQKWATHLKIEMERRHVPIPVDRELARQIHSVKKKVSAAKHNIFDTEKNVKHHADKFWALALAVYAATGGEGEFEVSWGSPLRGRR